MHVNILHRSIFDGGLISGECSGHFINVREGQSLRIEMTGHVFEQSLIPPVTLFLSISEFKATSHRTAGIAAINYDAFDSWKNSLKYFNFLYLILFNILCILLGQHCSRR